MTAFPNKKALIISEADNTLEKLTEEFLISPTYACMQMGAYCFAQIAAIYKNNDQKIPKDLEKFLTVTYPKLMADQASLIEEQYLMLTTAGTA